MDGDSGASEVKGGFRGSPRIFTIGYPGRSIRESLSLPGESGIRAIADVRRYPSSRKFLHLRRHMLSFFLGIAHCRIGLRHN